MDITADTPRAKRTIAGVEVSVPQPFAAGQVLSDATAAMLNQTLAENFSNNLRAAIAQGFVASENADPVPHTTETAQPLVDKYAGEYEPGVRRGGGGEARVVDPIEREALNIAKEKAREAIKSQGHKVTDYDVPTLGRAILEANCDLLMAEAKKIVKAREAAKGKGDTLDLTGIDFSAKASEAPAEQVAA